jgi:hypothetical protein
MRIEEFDAFKGELKQLCASLGKAYTDALGQAYWRVLRDVPLAEVEANVERVLLSAGKDTKFPKPMDLRTTPTRAQIQLPEEGVRRAQESWREKFARNPRLAKIDHEWCAYQYVIASSAPSSPEHQMAIEATLEILRRHGDPRWFNYGPVERPA